MIFCALSGGLGNQMFQFANAFSCAQKLKQKLILDTSELLGDGKRKYALGDFNLSNVVMEKNPKTLSLFSRISLGIFWPVKDIKEEKEFTFNPSVLNIKGCNRLVGYWQCPAYFEDHRNELIQIFSLKTLSDKFNFYKQLLTQETSVSIHVRRGDYVSELHTNQIHGICSIDYYKNAIQVLANKYPLTRFTYLIFSDDKNWSKDAFAFLESYKIIENLSDAEELLLMSLCKHNIIANSSFSWWAAWLNKHEYKTVIAPQNWFKQNLHDTKDLIPPNWTRI